MTRDDHTGLRRDGSQSIQEMAEQLAGEGDRRHWTADPDGKSKLTRIINAGAPVIAHPPVRVDLSNAEAVKARGRHYWAACAESGKLPTFAGLSAACGFSRKHLYAYLNSHDNETSQFLELFQTACADLLMQAGLTNSVNTIMSIFLLKNSGQGLADKSELEVTTVRSHSPLDDLPSPEEARRRLMDEVLSLPEIDDKNLLTEYAKKTSENSGLWGEDR